MTNKHCFILLVLTGFANALKAQSQGAGSVQTASLEMAEVVSASFFAPGSGAPQSVELPMSGTSAMSEGIESPEIEVTLQCTADFDISVASSSEYFTYSGPSTQNTDMPVEDVLKIMITENNTGGSVGNGFSQYQPINAGAGKQVISSGQRGTRKFSFKYKAQPGFNYPAGTYTTDIVYTVSKK